MIKVLAIAGTRPEAIKIAPVIIELKNHLNITTISCSTGQHRELLKGTYELFNISIDHNLDLMMQNQSLHEMTAKMFSELQKVIDLEKPDWVLAQGDTTTVMVASILSYYGKIKFGHIEAGLRTRNLYSPFPEEGNRIIADAVAHKLWAPTEKSAENLLKSGIKKEKIMVTGNTVIDALKLASEIPYDPERSPIKKYLKKRIVLITAHRRESFGEDLMNIFLAIKELAIKYSDLVFVYPVHYNPNVREQVNKILMGIENVELIEPLDYLDFINIMKRSFLILTDSGGIQEEAPFFNVPVLVMRNVTERQEGIEAGVSLLAGTDKEKIVNIASRIIEDKKIYYKMADSVNPFGDGQASQRIVKSIMEDK